MRIIYLVKKRLNSISKIYLKIFTAYAVLILLNHEQLISFAYL